MSAEVRRLTPEMQAAWINFDPGFEPKEPFSVSQMTFVRCAFFEGWIAAAEAAERIALEWRDENKAARDKARVRGRRRYDFDGDETHLVTAEQLDGAAIECNAIAQAIRALASRGEANV